MAPITGDSQPNGVHEDQILDSTNDRTKATRHPRWTRQETLILIEGKTVVENRDQRKDDALPLGQSAFKWDSISQYCLQHGVNRAPFQCRKRWGNLFCDFKKIKTWESRNADEAESFWMMRNERRKERKLPSFFDRDVYNVLDQRLSPTRAIPLAVLALKKDEKYHTNGDNAAAADKEAEQPVEVDDDETVSENGEHTRTGGGLSIDSEQPPQDDIGWLPIKKHAETENSSKTGDTPVVTRGGIKRKSTGSNTWMGTTSKDGPRKKKISLDENEDISLEDHLLKILEGNAKTLHDQLKAHNMNYEQERNQRKEHNDSLLGVLNKLTDALIRIADRL